MESLECIFTTTYGAYTNGSGGVGTSHFILPDLRGRVIAALDNMGGGSAGRITSPEGDILGNGGNTVNFGAEEHQLIAAQSGMPSHGHANTLGVNTGGLGISNVVNSVTVYGARGGGGDDGNFYHNGLMARNVSGQGNSFQNQATTGANSSAGNQQHTASITSSLTGSASITGCVSDNTGTDASAAHTNKQPTKDMTKIEKAKTSWKEITKIEIK